MQSAPFLKDLVLIGGGHAHLTVLKRFGMRPIPGVRLTLVSRNGYAPYSGMLPGFIAGHYAIDDLNFDLHKLAAFAGARFIQAEVTGLDLSAQRVLFAARPPLEFDLLSLNAGATPSLSDLAAIPDHLTPVKPIDEFNRRWQTLEARVREANRPLDIGVVGGGAGGVELILAAQYRLQSTGAEARGHRYHLICASEEVLPTHNRRVRARFAAILHERGIAVHAGQRVVRAETHRVWSASGWSQALDEVLWVTDAIAPPWFAAAGLAVDARGFVCIDAELRSTSHPNIFAAGDCAEMTHAPRPKSGVFAVRQGAPLAENLRRTLLKEALRPYRPQRAFLSLISTGDKYAVASRGTWCIGGAWVWQWKDWIDRRFMRRFKTLPTMSAAPVHVPAAFTTEFAALGDTTMRCGGCGAKVGAEIVTAALQTLPRGNNTTPYGLDARDDAALVYTTPGMLAIHTIDGFRALVSDPFLFGEITAAHCLGDVYAMGGTPTSALAYVTLPQAAVVTQQRDLTLLLAGVNRVLAGAGAALIGGHTSEGAELALALAVNGEIAPTAVWPKDAVQDGDALILTKPLGTGVLFAGAMRGLGDGAWLEEATAQMRQTNAAAVTVLREFTVHAATDITGFGLAGHLAEMLRGGQLQAELSLIALPLLPGAEFLIGQGVRSSLHRQNERLDAAIHIRDRQDAASRYPLLFDPQTSGGLLAAIPLREATGCLAALHRAGVSTAAQIGVVYRK